MVNPLSPMKKYVAEFRGKEYTGLDKDTPALDVELPHGAKLCALGIVLPEELDEKQWIAVGKTLITIGRSAKWALAELVVRGDLKYGDRAEVAKKLNYDLDYLYNLATVARKVPISSRNENLSFAHHMAVTKFEPDVQKKWLAKAFRGSAAMGVPAKPWTVVKLRQAIHDEEETHRQMDERKLEQENPEAYKKAQSLKSGEAVFDQFEKVKRGDWFLSNSIRAITSDQPFITDLPDQTIGVLIEAASGIADMFHEVVSVLKKHQERRAKPRDDDDEATVEAQDTPTKLKRLRLPESAKRQNKRDRAKKAA